MFFIDMDENDDFETISNGSSSVIDTGSLKVSERLSKSNS